MPPPAAAAAITAASDAIVRAGAVANVSVGAGRVLSRAASSVRALARAVGRGRRTRRELRRGQCHWRERRRERHIGWPRRCRRNGRTHASAGVCCFLKCLFCGRPLGPRKAARNGLLSLMRRPFRSSSGAWLPLHTKDILTCVRAVPRFVHRYSAELSCCLIGTVLIGC